MNKERKHIDDLFREELKGFSQESSMADFDAIMGKMDNKKKKRFLFWWFFAGASLIAVAIGLYFSNVNQEKEKNAPLTEIVTQSEVEIKEKREMLSGGSESWIGKNLDLDKSAFREVESHLGKKEKSSNRIFKNNGEKDLTEPVEDKHKNNLIEHKNSGLEDEGLKNKPTDLETEIAIEEEKDEEKEEKIQFADAGTLDQNSKVLKDTLEDKEKEQVHTAMDSSTLKKSVIPNKPIFNTSDSKWRLELMGNYMMANRNISSSNNYASIRENDDKNLATFNLGLQLHRNLYKGFNLGTGFEMNTYSYDADYSYKREEYDKVWVINPSNDTIGFFKDNIRDTLEEYKTNNVIKVVRIPLNISFDLNFRNQGLRFGAGLYGEKTTNSKGSMPDQAELRKVTSDTEINKKILFGWNAEIGYYRMLSGNLNLELNTKYGASFSNLLEGNNAKDKPRLIGLGVGLSYRF